MKAKVLTLMLLLILTIMAGGGCKKEEATLKKDEKNTLKIALLGIPQTFNPLTATDQSSCEISDILYRGLIGWNEKWEPFPVVATVVPSLSNGRLIRRKNNVMMEFPISETFRWSNGIYLESNDFLFNYQMALYPGIQKKTESWVRTIGKISTNRKELLQVTWKGLDPASMTYLKPLPRQMIEAAIFQNPHPFFTELLKWQRVINGPYELAQGKIKNEKLLSIDLVRNPEYYRNKPAIFRYAVKFFQTNEAFESDVLAGTFDVIPHMEFSQGKALSKNPEFTVLFTPSTSLYTIFFDTNSKPLNDKNLRKALVMALDREDMAKKIYEDKVQVAQSWLPLKNKYHVPVFEKLKFDQKETIRLLKEAGWEKKEGIWKKGQDELVLSINYGNDAEAEKLARQIKESWERIGIKVNEVKIQAESLVDELASMNEAKKYPQVIVDIMEVPPWVNPPYLFSRVFTPTSVTKDRGQNFSRWYSPDNEKLCFALYQEFDPQKKEELFAEQQKLVAEEVPCFPLFSRLSVSACRKNIRNFSPRGFGTNTWNIEFWEAEAPKDKK